MGRAWEAALAAEAVDASGAAESWLLGAADPLLLPPGVDPSDDMPGISQAGGLWAASH